MYTYIIQARGDRTCTLHGSGEPLFPELSMRASCRGLYQSGKLRLLVSCEVALDADMPQGHGVSCKVGMQSCCWKCGTNVPRIHTSTCGPLELVCDNFFCPHCNQYVMPFGIRKGILQFMHEGIFMYVLLYMALFDGYMKVSPLVFMDKSVHRQVSHLCEGPLIL